MKITDPNFPRAIVHFDGDAFFASVEQLMNYRLRGRPVVTGAERGAATSLSYEAKGYGLHRGMPLSEMKRRCPGVVIVRSDYMSYSIFGARMYKIARQFTPLVEEYSIDECFADITDLLGVAGDSYEEIALSIKDALQTALGLTFGVGLAPTKTLAKAASKFRKPDSFTAVGISDIPDFLEQIPITEVWGLGGASGLRLEKLGVRTARALREMSEAWVSSNHLTKPFRDTWHELCGRCVKPVVAVPDDRQGSIMKTRTFSPPSASRALVLSELSKNIEDACTKARRHKLRARGASFYLKTQEFTYRSADFTLTVPTASARTILFQVRHAFDKAYVPDVLYRATGVTLRGLVPEHAESNDLFGERLGEGARETLERAMDAVNHRHGRASLFLGSSFMALARRTPERVRHPLAKRDALPLPIELRKKTLGLPYLGIAH